MHEQPRALVTGASGYIGSHVTRCLVDEGWMVAGLTRGPARSAGAAARDIAMFSTDGSFESVRQAVDAVRPTVVFHLAAVVLAVPRPEDVDSLIQSNVLLVAQITEAMLGVGADCLVNTGTYWQFESDGSMHPRTLYAATKQAAEDIVEYECTRGLRAATLILHDVYGPADPRPKLLNRLAVLPPGNEPVDLSSGAQTLDYVYIDDVARAFMAAATWLLGRTSAGHERFVVRGQRPMTLRAVVDALQVARGVELPVRWGARPHQDHDIIEPWLGGRAVPEWAPCVPLEEGLRRMVRSTSP